MGRMDQPVDKRAVKDTAVVGGTVAVVGTAAPEVSDR